MASFEGDSATYFSVTLGSPSRTMRCTMMSDLKTIVHVESLRRFCRARKISATPASPAWVATRICSTYLALGGASLIFVPPLTDFSKDPDMADGHPSQRQVRAWLFAARLLVLEVELEGFRAFHRSYRESPVNGVMLSSL